MDTPKKIPTLLAIVMLVVIIGVISFVVTRITTGTTTASPTIEPKNVQITNVSDTSGTIIWQTDEATTGLISLTKGSSTLTSYDDRDMTGKMNKYTMHSITIKNLTPNTSYDFSILSNGKKYPQTGKLYSLRTASSITGDVGALDPAYGIVKKFDGRPGEGALVTFSFDGSQTLSTIVRSTGSWMIPLNLLRTKDMEAYFKTQKEGDTTGVVTVMLDDQKSEALIDAKNISPVPDITIGQTYDYRNYQVRNKQKQTLADTKSSTPSPTSTPAVLGEQTTKQASSSPTPKIGGVTITTPLENGSVVSTKPLIQGTGIPGKTVTITIGITKPQTGKVSVGANGLWQFTPTTALGEGKQSVTATTVDSKNKTIAITVNFTVLKSGTQVLGDATPSATTPTPTEASIAAEPIPETGSTLPTVLLIVMGIFFVVGGTALLIR